MFSRSALPGLKTQHPRKPHPNHLKTLQKNNPSHCTLKLVIKEEVLPTNDEPEFLLLELLAARALLASDTWKCKRAQVSLKVTLISLC